MITLRAVIWCAVSTKIQATDDKISLADQEQQARALCEKNAWPVVAVLKVPGFSRDYFTIAECAAAMAAEGIDAFRDLQDLISRRAFDLLICYGGDRFARKQSLHSEIVERVIDAGARIFILRNNAFVDASNYRMFSAMDGFRSASEIDVLKERNRLGRDARVPRGLPQGEVPLSHILVRDEKGHPLRLELRPGLERFWPDLANLLLAGHGYTSIARALRDLGHRNPATGRAFSPTTLHRLLHNPFVWGVSARHYAGRYGLWAFDESVPLPEGVLLDRSPSTPIPSVWTGPLAMQIQSELRRRAEIIRGTARPFNSYVFTGLLICAECGRRFIHSRRFWNNKPYGYWHCSNAERRQVNLARCGNRRKIPDSRVRDQVTRFLLRWLSLARPELPLPADPQLEARLRAASLREEIAALTQQIETLIARQAIAPLNLQEFYIRRLDESSIYLDQLRASLRQAESALEPAHLVEARALAYAELQAEDLDALWRTPSHANQLLHRLLGRHRFVVASGQIVSVR